MKPKVMNWSCQICRQKLNIPADMGNQTFKCPCCGAFFKYRFRNGTFEQIERPERTTASGMRLY